MGTLQPGRVRRKETHLQDGGVEWRDEAEVEQDRVDDDCAANQDSLPPEKKMAVNRWDWETTCAQQRDVTQIAAQNTFLHSGQEGT